MVLHPLSRPKHHGQRARRESHGYFRQACGNTAAEEQPGAYPAAAFISGCGCLGTWFGSVLPGGRARRLSDLLGQSQAHAGLSLTGET